MKIDSKELHVTQNGYSVTGLRYFILKYQNRISLIVVAYLLWVTG